MLLFFIRHGDPIYSPDSLTPLGHRQAEALAGRLSLHGLDKLFVSSSRRARQTAEPTCRALRLQATVLDWCNEGHAWEEMTVINKEGYPCWAFLDSRMRQCFASEEMFLLGKRWYEHPAIQATTMKQGFERIQENADTFLESLGYRHTVNGYEAIRPNTERVALFAHQGFGLAFLSAVLDIPYPLFSLRFDMGHTGMTVIEFGAGEGLVIPRVLQLSNDSHIYKEGLETSYQNEILI